MPALGDESGRIEAGGFAVATGRFGAGCGTGTVWADAIIGAVGTTARPKRLPPPRPMYISAVAVQCSTELAPPYGLFTTQPAQGPI